MDTYSLPLQTVKLICNTDNISTGAGDMRHRVAGAVTPGMTAPTTTFTKFTYIMYFFLIN